MSELKLLKVYVVGEDGDGVLRRPSEEVKDITPELRALALMMVQTMTYRGAIGLAAPQVGKNVRLICIDTQKSETDGVFNVMFNPEIVGFSNEVVKSVEGCLSLPKNKYEVHRHKEVYVKYMTLNGKSKIKQFSGLASVVIQHECLPANSIVYTEKGKKPIKWLIDNNYRGKVLSFNHNTNVFEYQKVIDSTAKLNKDKKKWIMLKYSNTGPNKHLICTEDHKVAYIDDILNLEIKYDFAKNLKNKYLVRNIDINRSQNKEHPLYNHEQLEAIVGCVLGDSHVDKTGSLTSTHSRKHAEYAKYKQSIIGGKLREGYSGYLQKYSNVNLHSHITEQTKKLRKLFYKDKKKTIKDVIPFISEISLAFWYMDDGCLKGSRNSTFHTESFSLEDNEILVEHFNKKFGLYPSIYTRNIRGNKKYVLYFDVQETIKLNKIIAPYVCEHMKYKIIEDFHHLVGSKKIDNAYLGYSAKLVSKIVHKKTKESKLYDITVENNHNFVANETLVHNCDHLDGILISDKRGNNGR